MDHTGAPLAIRDLHKTFDPGLLEPKVRALRGLSLEVGRGEVFGFLGPNGAGKTTTIKVVMGLIRPDRGEILVCGRPPADRDARRRTGFMTESPYIYRHLTGAEHLRFHATLLGLDRAEADRRIGRLLDEVGLRDRAGVQMRTFSKGMLQRLSWAQALLGEPELLVLDEPMSGLDPVGRRDLRDLILAQRDRGTTVFFSTHIIPDVESLCDRVAVVVDGRLRASGAVREIVDREAEAYEVGFTGVGADRLGVSFAGLRTADQASWARIRSDDRDRLLAELGRHGGRLLSLTPVRNSLEDFVLRHYREQAS